MKVNLINVVIVDDEEDSIGVMKILLKKYCPEVNIIASFNDSTQALDFLKQTQPDILFLDIEMPRLNGFELLSSLGKFSFKTVFVTAYDEFGIKAIKYAIFDYLVKPIDSAELIQTVHRYKMHLENNEITKQTKLQMHEKLLVPVGNEYEFIEINKIIRCEADDNYTTIHQIETSPLLISKTLKYIEESLPTNDFIRVHNKHLINVAFIKKYIKADGGYFELINKETVPLSRYKKEEVLKSLGLRD